MSRFKRIKNTSTKKSSVSIDEKIASLNQELKKTGIISEMDTSNVYQTTSLEPNQTHSSFNAASFNGLGLGHSGSDGEGSGGAYTGKVIAGEHGLQSPAHDSILNLDGVAVSPPHPVSGKRVYASTRTGMVSFSPTQPGKIQGNRELPTGSVMWIWNPNANNSDGTTGQWYPLEFSPTHNQYGFWDTGFLGFAFLNINLDQLEFTSGDNTGATLLSLVNSLGITNTNNIGAPETNVLTQDPLGDPAFLPIDIMKSIAGFALGAAKEAFEFFKSKAKSPPKPEKDYERNRINNRPKPRSKPKPKSTPKPDPENITGDDGTTFGPNKGQPKKQPKYKSNRKKNRPDVEGAISPQDIKNAADYLKNTAKFYGAVPTAANNMLYHNNVQNPNHPDHRKHDPSSDKYVGPKKVIFNPIEQAQTDKMIEGIIGSLNNGKGPKDPNKLSLEEIEALSTGMNAKYNENPTWYNTFHSLPTHNGADGEPITKVTKNKFGGWDVESNYIFSDDQDASDPFSNAFAKIPVWTPRKATVKSAKTNKNAEGGEVFKNKATGEVIGKQFNTQQVYRGRQPRTFSGGVKESYIIESVGLGHFEPEELNVDIEDIRKGIMPEYPKKAPPEMIDGYSVASKLAPRVIKGEPTIKITKKDLAKFHKLKKSEIDEFMNDVNQINDYLQKNPADLIYVQQRYPKDDPRLAALNWKMDQMLEAGEEYMDSNFKENKKLFKRATEHTLKNIKLTDPKYVQQKYDELRGTPKPKRSINKRNVSRFFKKPVNKKSSMEEIDDKIKQLDKDLLL